MAVVALGTALFLLAGSASALDLQSILGNPEADNFQIIHVQDLARLMNNSDAKVHIFDANPTDVRESTGIIPGARLLASSNYDVATELPPDKSAKLVFYCHNLH